MRKWSAMAVMSPFNSPKNGDGSFFEHIGLPPDSTWEQFCEHYADRGGPSSERVGNDLATYPPIARRIAELQIERDQIA